MVLFMANKKKYSIILYDLKKGEYKMTGVLQFIFLWRNLRFVELVR